jgi:tetratricopeptide (TPR) repeat protein
VAETSRIDQLRRRVEQDAASIAFAQLAEEYRRAGDLDGAVRVARAGLQRHPGYLSARITLGRALVDLGRFDEAEAEFDAVAIAAPENLIAVRELAELHQRRSDLSPVSVPGDAVPARSGPAPVQSDQALERLQAWHAAILRDRQSRTNLD